LTLLESVILATIVIIEFSFATFFILKWLVKNLKFEKPNVVVQNQTSLPQMTEETEVANKNLGVIEVDVKKQLNISEADISDLKMDEEVKGKVKTQKNKLKKLRG
tara:strand:+ start:705 stop:1019 length:315 start_codon:yes stop_codon:yes gene_type:complete